MITDLTDKPGSNPVARTTRPRRRRRPNNDYDHDDHETNDDEQPLRHECAQVERCLLIVTRIVIVVESRSEPE
jgi:hypothetical protein